MITVTKARSIIIDGDDYEALLTLSELARRQIESGRLAYENRSAKHAANLGLGEQELRAVDRLRSAIDNEYAPPQSPTMAEVEQAVSYTQQLEAQVKTLTVERDEARARVAELEAALIHVENIVKGKRGGETMNTAEGEARIAAQVEVVKRAQDEIRDFPPRFEETT